MKCLIKGLEVCCSNTTDKTDRQVQSSLYVGCTTHLATRMKVYGAKRRVNISHSLELTVSLCRKYGLNKKLKRQNKS